MAVNMNRVIFIKNIKPAYEKRDLQESTDLNRLKELFLSWGFSNMICTSSSWFIEEDPTHGPIIAWEDDGDITLYLDENLQYVKFKSKKDDSKICEVSTSSKFVLSTNMWYVAPNHWAMPIFELGFAIDASWSYRYSMNGFEDGLLFGAELMKNKTLVEDTASSVVFNTKGALGSGQISIPNYKINNININGWSFPSAKKIEEDEMEEEENKFLCFKNPIDYGSNVKVMKSMNLYLSLAAPTEILANDFNQEIYEDHWIERFGGKLFVDGKSFTLEEDEKLILYSRPLYKGATINNNISLSIQNHSDAKFEEQGYGSNSTLTTTFNLNGNLSIKLTPPSGILSKTTIVAIDVTKDVQSMQNGDSYYFYELQGNSAAARYKTIIRPCTYYFPTVKITEEFSNITLYPGDTGSGKVWNCKIKRNMAPLSFTPSTNSFVAYTIPDDLSTWENASRTLGYSHYCRRKAYAYRVDALNLDLDINFTLWVPGGLFYDEHSSYAGMKFGLTLPTSNALAGGAVFKKQQDWTEDEYNNWSTSYKISGSKHWTPTITFKSNIYFSTSTRNYKPYALVKWKNFN